jgi:hypothetical protein
MPRSARLALLPHPKFLQRAAGFILFALVFLTLALGIGTVGYHVVARLDWIDAFLNAAMILTGMGPVDPMPDDAAKLFASIYALVAGAVYPAITAIVLYPFLHRMLKALHLEALAAAAEAQETPPDD